MSVKLGKRIEIDESNFKSLKIIDELKTIGENDKVCLSNDSEDIETDEKALYDYLKNLEGADRVESLTIDWSSDLKNVEIIRAFPNLRFLHVWGHNIVTLDGLECFEKGELIDIDTGRNRKRNIEKITHVPIRRMYLNYGQKTDFEVIGKCLSLKKLEINKGPSPEFYEWRNVPLEHLQMQGKFTELRDMGHLKALDQLMLTGCRTFERFSGDNSSVRSLTVYGCRRFDIRSLSSLQGIELVTINSCAREMVLSELPEHPTIRRLGLHFCKVNVDMYDLKERMPKLEKIAIPKLTKEKEQLLSQANPDIEIMEGY